MSALILGFKSQGFVASWEQLQQLRIPVLVYVKHRKSDHFSVLRGINQHTVWLADPSRQSANATTQLVFKAQPSLNIQMKSFPWGEKNS